MTYKEQKIMDDIEAFKKVSEWFIQKYNGKLAYDRTFAGSYNELLDKTNTKDRIKFLIEIEV